MENPYCRRCGFRRLIKLKKMLVDDHDVYRCGECGYIFSPPAADSEEDISGFSQTDAPPREDKVWAARKIVGIPRDRVV